MKPTHRKSIMVSTASPVSRVISGMHSVQAVAPSTSLAALQARRINATFAMGGAKHAVCDAAECAAPVIRQSYGNDP